jgi:hypothetical protein
LENIEIAVEEPKPKEEPKTMKDKVVAGIEITTDHFPWMMFMLVTLVPIFMLGNCQDYRFFLGDVHLLGDHHYTFQCH